MISETTAFAQVLTQIARDIIAQLEGLSDAELNQPVPLPEANTLAALATHTLGAGEFWTLVLVGGQAIPRDRPAEFRAVGHGPALIARFEGWIVALQALLADLPAEALGPVPHPPPGRRLQAIGDAPLTGRDCLLRAVEHSATHLGHIQLTRQLVLALRDGQLTPAHKDVGAQLGMADGQD
ncbi:MAG: DinB family protein [Chloroflexales bacterium]|nr:DinB family protein [Chloroflexales bacterium]